MTEAVDTNNLTPSPADITSTNTPAAAITAIEVPSSGKNTNDAVKDSITTVPSATGTAEQESNDNRDETATEESLNSNPEDKTTRTINNPIVSDSKKTRPAYTYDKDKITLRFLFANRDGLTVTVQCDPSDTVGEVKAALLSVWPEGEFCLYSLTHPFRVLHFSHTTQDMDACEASEDLRLVCMGKGYLMPDSRTLQDCEIPVFKTHPTPINVSVKPKISVVTTPKSRKDKVPLSEPANGTVATSQGCCTIL